MWGRPPSAVRRAPARLAQERQTPCGASLRGQPKAAVPTCVVRYHVPVHSLAERVLSHIRRQELLTAGDRVGVAVSGGIDSVALLRVLLELRGELGIVLSVVHFNHKLRGAESDADQEFVASLARELDLAFHVDSEDVARHAAEEHVSVETSARELRYGFFRHLLGEDEADLQGLKPDSFAGLNGTAEAVPFHEPPSISSASHQSRTVHLTYVATGHTLDDQAETVLMRMIRGAGLRGLGGIHPRILVEDDGGEISGEIVRPLLGVRRRELEQYLKDIGQSWREDSSNADEHFTRNRVRKLVVPLLEQEFNPAVAENLAELAEIARGEEDYWENEVSGWLGTTVQWSQPEWARVLSPSFVQISLGEPKAMSSQDEDLHMKIDSAPWLVMNASVSRMWFLGEPIAVQRRLVKAIGENAGIPLEFKHVLDLQVAQLDGAVREGGVEPIGPGGEGVVGADVDPPFGDLGAEEIAHHRRPLAQLAACQLKMAARLERLHHQAAGPGEAPARVAAGLKGIDAAFADAGGEVGERNVDRLELRMQRQGVRLILVLQRSAFQ